MTEHERECLDQADAEMHNWTIKGVLCRIVYYIGYLVGSIKR